MGHDAFWCSDAGDWVRGHCLPHTLHTDTCEIGDAGKTLHYPKSRAHISDKKLEASTFYYFYPFFLMPPIHEGIISEVNMGC